MDILSSLREKWWEELRGTGLFPPPPGAGQNADYRSAIDEFYDQFSKGSDFVAAWAALQRLCYWQPGDYHAVVKFNSTEPEQIFDFSFSFSLSQAESSQLYANAIPMLRQNAGITDAPLFFAYPKLQIPPGTAKKIPVS